jgi:hypothetical protein
MCSSVAMGSFTISLSLFLRFCLLNLKSWQQQQHFSLYIFDLGAWLTNSQILESCGIQIQKYHQDGREQGKGYNEILTITACRKPEVKIQKQALNSCPAAQEALLYNTVRKDEPVKTGRHCVRREVRWSVEPPGGSRILTQSAGWVCGPRNIFRKESQEPDNISPGDFWYGGSVYRLYNY